MTRLTPPGDTDLHWMSVVCTPESTHVEFHEIPEEANDAARANLATGVSVYVGQIMAHGEHTVRSDSKTVILEVRVDSELRHALAHHSRTKTRAEIKSLLESLLAADLEQIRSDYLAMRARAR